ncbi:MAG: cell wall hydrolase [Pseudomonadota bacterium]
MSRQTYSFGAIAIVATISMSFPNADGAEAFAQDRAAEETVASAVESETTDGASVDSFEVVPNAADSEQSIRFVSNPVEQIFEQAEPFDAVATDARSLRELVSMVEPGDLSDQMQCLAGAVYFESRGEPLAGQLAVAQVVINRSEDARWPASYCGVVYQRAQFSFVKNGRMPRIRTSSGAWQRAQAIAKIAHDGLWESEAADAVYFHASYVRPKWSRRKERTAKIDTHIFYR